jgi:hypothetical protein
MNVEILKEIVKLFQTATEGAVTVGIWWMVRGFVLNLTGWSLGFYVTYRAFNAILLAIGQDKLKAKIIQVMKEKGIKNKEYYDEPFYNNDSTNYIIDCLKKNLKK